MQFAMAITVHGALDLISPADAAIIVLVLHCIHGCRLVAIDYPSL